MNPNTPAGRNVNDRSRSLARRGWQVAAGALGALVVIALVSGGSGAAEATGSAEPSAQSTNGPAPSAMKSRESAPKPDAMKSRESAPRPGAMKSRESAPKPDAMKSRESAPKPDAMKSRESAPQPDEAVTQ
jgi:hypothetical protein